MFRYRSDTSLPKKGSHWWGVARQYALAAAKVLRLPLVVAKVDRLARNVRFLEEILASAAPLPLQPVANSGRDRIASKLAYSTKLRAGFF